MAAAATATSSVPLLGAPGTECKYYKKKLIGNGSYGEAWLVDRVSDHAVFVAKIMDLGKMSARDKQYAYSEIKCLAACDHPNIIRYMEDAEDENSLTIVMEFADAGDLDRQIKSRNSDNKKYFQEHEALFLFLQIALAMHHIHSHKMLHRDIKGANVMLNSAGLVKLGDFGFSHQYSDTVSAGVASTFLGTPYYLAPELWNNQRYSKKADVWSLGILLYEILGLCRPFVAGNMKGLMQKVMAGEYAPLPDRFSAEFKDVVRQLLVVDANRRPTLDEVFQIPYVKAGLAQLRDTVDRNPKITPASKDGLKAHIDAIFAAPPAAASGAAMGPVGQINNAVAAEGIVFKLGAGNQPTWKERYLVLQRGHLILCDKKGDEKSGKALGLDQIQSVCPVPSSNAKRDWVFSLNTHGGKSMWLQAPTKADMEMWLDAIHRAMGIA